MSKPKILYLPTPSHTEKVFKPEVFERFLNNCRRFVDHAIAIREKGVWKDKDIPGNGQFLRGSVVGVVSASKVGREVIRLLQPFDVKILIYDPYLSDWEAGRLNVEKVELDDVFAKSDFVTVHAPNIPETWGMIVLLCQLVNQGL